MDEFKYDHNIHGPMQIVRGKDLTRIAHLTEQEQRTIRECIASSVLMQGDVRQAVFIERHNYSKEGYTFVVEYVEWLLRSVQGPDGLMKVNVTTTQVNGHIQTNGVLFTWTHLTDEDVAALQRYDISTMGRVLGYWFPGALDGTATMSVMLHVEDLAKPLQIHAEVVPPKSEWPPEKLNALRTWCARVQDVFRPNKVECRIDYTMSSDALHAILRKPSTECAADLFKSKSAIEGLFSELGFYHTESLLQGAPTVEDMTRAAARYRKLWLLICAYIDHAPRSGMHHLDRPEMEAFNKEMHVVELEWYSLWDNVLVKK